MRAPALIALCAASLGLFGYAAVSLLGGPEKPADAPAAGPAPTAAKAPRERPKRAADDDRDAIARALAQALERALEAEPEAPLPLTSESRQEAEVSFEVVMEKLEALADKGDPLSKRRRRRLYRAANDSFSALSAHLDPHSAQDMQTLEDAHARLKHMLREVEAGPP